MTRPAVASCLATLSLGFLLGKGLPSLSGCADPPWPPAPVVVAPAPASASAAGADASGRGPVLISDNPLFTIFERDEEAYASFKKSLARPAKSLEVTAPGSLTATAVLETSRVEVRDDAPAPLLYGVRLDEGERASLPLDAKKPGCFTIVAHGGLGVAEVDAFIVDGPDQEPRALGEDSKRGPIAVVGGQGGCAKTAHDCGPVCFDAGKEAPRVEVVARRGAGPIVVGVSRRDR